MNGSILPVPRRPARTRVPACLKCCLCVLLWLGAQAQAGADFTDSLQGYWPMDGNGLDESGSGRDLTIQGGAAFGTGLIGQALALTGNATQFADRGGVDDAALDPGGAEFSMQVWVNFNSAGGEQTLMEKFTGGAGPGYTLSKLNTGQVQLFATAFSLTTGAQSFFNSTWYHLVFTRNGSTNTLYLNGSPIGQNTSTQSVPNTSADLMIGERDGAQTFPVNGAIDEAAFWSRGLSASEVSMLYNSGTGFSIVLPVLGILCPPDVTNACGDSISTNITGSATTTGTCATAATIWYEDSTVVAACSNVISRVWSATNACGGFAICTQLITQIDMEDPVVVCPSNVVIECGDSTDVSETGMATASDDCDTNVVVSFADTTAGDACTSVISRVWTAMDACGNSDVCTQTITMVDTTPPGGPAGVEGWAQCGSDLTNVPGDSFGNDAEMSRDGEWLVVGQQGFSNLTGRVMVYEKVGEAWIQRGSNIVGQAFERFGWSVAISSNGQRIAVGAIQVNLALPGSVQAYDFSGGEWAPVGNTLVGLVNNDQYGYAVDLSDDGSRLAVGAGNSAFALGTDYVQIFELGAGVWNQLGSTINGEQPGDRFGWALDLSGDGNRIVVGAREYNTSASGRVRAFEWSGATWTPLGSSIDGVGFFGASVAASADGAVIAVGASLNSAVGSNFGQARVFNLVSNDWAQVGSNIFGDASALNLGEDIDLSSDGQRLAVGTRVDRTRVFNLNTGTWTQVGADIVGAGPGPLKGTAVSISGSGAQVAVGVRAGVFGAYSDIFRTYLFAAGGPTAFTCPADLVIECGSSILPGVTGTPVASDNCDTNVAVTFADVQTGACPSVILRTWTATDACGNAVVCTQAITQVDSTPPVITCSPDLYVTNYFGAGGAYVSFSVTNSDVCDPAPLLTCSHNSGDFFLYGTTTVVCVSVDACSNSNTCSNTIAVVEQAFLDADGDGIDDNYETLVFSNLVTAGTGTDFDSDGVDDADEYGSGTDATDSNDFLRVLPQPMGIGTSISWPSKPGQMYSIQYTEKIVPSTWSNIADELTSGFFTDTNAARINIGKGYYRLVVP